MSFWFGDEDATRRRRQDQAQDEYARYRGYGPKNYKRSDERIREDVSDRLSDDPYVNAEEIEVLVSNSEVTLSGTADDREQRRRAEVVAERISGVSHVQNNLRVRDRRQAGQGSGQFGQLGSSQQESSATKAGASGSSPGAAQQGQSSTSQNH